MATQKPISTISYNSEPFLKFVLKKLMDDRKIYCYQYIKHIGEDGDKDHIHLRLEPNKRLDLMDLQKEFLEPVPGSKPLGCRPFRPSKEEDWLLYAVHNADYLKTKYIHDKGEKRPYDYTDIKVSEYYDLEIAFGRALRSLDFGVYSLVGRVRAGQSADSLLLSGANPHTLNTIYSLLSKTDYQKALAEIKRLETSLCTLLESCREHGLTVRTDGAVYYIDDCFDFKIFESEDKT